MKKNIKYLIPIFTIIVLFVIYAIYNVIVCGKDGCNNLRIKNSKFCSKHTCSNENCFNEKIPGFDICYSCFEENSNEEEYTLTDNQLQQAHNTINEYCNNLMEKQSNILAINLINNMPESVTDYSCTFKCNVVTKESDINIATILLLIDKDGNFSVQNLLYDDK